MSKSFQLSWLNQGLISILGLTTVFVGVYSSILYFNNDLSNSSKTAHAATTYTCDGIGGTLSGTNCILDRTVGYNNTAGGAIPNYSVTDPTYSTTNGWTLAPGSIYNNYVDGLRVQLSDNAYNAAGTLQTSPSAGFFDQSTDARSGLLEMGKYRFVSEQKCAIPGQQDEIFTRAPGYNTALVGKFDSTGNNCAATVAGSFVSAYNVPISGARYISLQVCGIPGNLNELFLDGQPVNSPSNCADTVAGSLLSRNVMDLLGNRYINVQNCVIPGVQNEIFAWSTSPNPDGSNNCAGTVAGSAASVFSIDLFDPSRGAGNIQYQIVHAAAVATSDLTEADIPGLNVVCNSGAPTFVNIVVVCYFQLPANKTLPADFKLTIGNGGIDAGGSFPAQLCGNANPPLTGIVCTNVPTGNSVGIKQVFGNLGSGNTATKTATGETVTISGVNFGAIDWQFSPDQGGTGPLFRSADSTSITVKNFRTVYDPTPTSSTRYKCTLAYRPLNDRATTAPTWNFVNQIAVDYNITTGCTFNITKAMRGNNLNYSLRVNISDPNTVITGISEYNFYNEYIYRFQGAGVASGG
jgi:hypothetical protein